ncbi:MAG: aminopeptidase [Marinilabiliaceae bacterium]|nr:aminopeptidase [Marinilabiliaceae bacterium]
MRKRWMIFLIFLALIIQLGAAQEDSINKNIGYQFTTIKELPVTTVKDQNMTGTCWSFSGLGFIEAEMLRMGKPHVDLSEMYIVWHTYYEKAVKKVRMHGEINFSAGGAFHDVTNMIKKYGIVPNSVYEGLNYGEENHVHSELDKMLSAQVGVVIENRNRKLSTAWQNTIKGTLNVYLGELPTTFKYEGKEYTPQSFATSYVGLNLSDYVEIGSYTHQPFYTSFPLEIPDNWMWEPIYNVPLADFEAIVDYAIENGFPVAWAADVSEKGFSSKTHGVAIIPDIDRKEMSDAEIARWEKMTTKEKEDSLYTFKKPGKEKLITQQLRQQAFDNYQTTDDHGMLIYGTAKDQNGNYYYMVKNSWGDYNKYDGMFYASKPYYLYKSTGIMVHKDAIPKVIRKKLGL